MKISLTSVLLTLIANACFSQDCNEHLANLPLRNGVIYSPPPIINGYPGKYDGIFLRSSNDSCFAVADGTVSSMYDLGGEYAVAMMTADSIFPTYTPLNYPFVKQGDKIKKGDFIGTLHPLDDGTREVLFMMVDANSGFYSIPEIKSFLKIANGDCVAAPVLHQKRKVAPERTRRCM